MAGMDELRSVFVTGLKNAHAMENQALSIMKPQVQRIENYPEMAQRLQQHIAETEMQIERLDTVLDTMGEDKSGLKDLALSMAGAMAALGHTVAPDEILKNTFANFAFENFEIAAYRSLITLAEAGGATHSLSALQQNLREEEEMASWIEANLSSVTLQYAGLREAGLDAKR